MSVTFVESKKYPKNDLNPSARWSVSWEIRREGRPVVANKDTGALKRTGNSWANKAYAEEMFARKLSEGTNPEASVSYCAFSLSL